MKPKDSIFEDPHIVETAVFQLDGRRVICRFADNCFREHTAEEDQALWETLRRTAGELAAQHDAPEHN